jgi:predicted dehydrogenase
MNHSFSIGRRRFLVAGLANAASSALDAQSQEHGAKTIRYGVVGCGTRSVLHHLPFVKRCVPEVEVAALCDITPEALERARAIWPGAATHTDYRRMLAEHPEIEAVVVVIPNYLHAEVAVAALEAGKHVLVEKPMAIRLTDADRMVSAARKGNRILQVGMQARYSEVLRRMSQLIREGAIGDVEFVFASLFRGDWNPRSWRYTDPATGRKTNWRFLTKTAGSSLCEDGIHELDVIHWLVGAEPVRIQAQGGNNVLKDRETIDHAGLLIEFANGAKLNFAFTLFTPVRSNEVFRVYGSKAEMSFDGDWWTSQGAGEIVIQSYSPAVKADRISVPNLRRDEAAWSKGAPFDAGTARQHREFVKSITTGAPVFVDGKTGRDAVHIALAAERSLRTGQILRWNDEEDL